MAAVTFMVADHLPARLRQPAVQEAFQPSGDDVEPATQALEFFPGFTTAGAADVNRSRAIVSSSPTIGLSKTPFRTLLTSSQVQVLQAAADRNAFDPGITAPSVPPPVTSASMPVPVKAHRSGARNARCEPSRPIAGRTSASPSSKPGSSRPATPRRARHSASSHQVAIDGRNRPFFFVPPEVPLFH